jgi:hypothetical protein
MGQAAGMKVTPDSCTASEATSKLWIFPLSVVNCELKPLRLLLVHYLRTSLAVAIWIDQKNDLILIKLKFHLKILNVGSCNLS